MNDNQIISFLENRAKKIGLANGFGDSTPHLGIIRSGNNFFLCILYVGISNLDLVSIIRFKQNGQYGMFKLTSDSEDFIAWKNQLLSKTKFSSIINYTKANVPNSINHLVISTVIKALNTPGMSLTITLADKSEMLISEYENYASICIDYDLNFDSFMNL